MNNIRILTIHPLFIPIHPLEDEWVKIDPHSSPFPIHLLWPGILYAYLWVNTVFLYCHMPAAQIARNWLPTFSPFKERI